MILIKTIPIFKTSILEPSFYNAQVLRWRENNYTSIGKDGLGIHLNAYYCLIGCDILNIRNMIHMYLYRQGY